METRRLQKVPNVLSLRAIIKVVPSSKRLLDLGVDAVANLSTVQISGKQTARPKNTQSTIGAPSCQEWMWAAL
jgi:hypothetical protein